MRSLRDCRNVQALDVYAGVLELLATLARAPGSSRRRIINVSSMIARKPAAVRACSRGVVSSVAIMTMSVSRCYQC